MDIARQVDHDEEDFKNLDREIWKKNPKAIETGTILKVS